MTQQDERDPRIAALQDRLTRLSEASLLINDSLDIESVLQNVLDSARSLTNAQYGVMTTLDTSGQIDDVLATGLTTEEAQQLWEMPGGMEIFKFVNAVPGPLRLANFAAHTSALGLPEFRPPAPMSAFLTVPIRHHSDRVGSIHMAKGEPGEEFTREDEETMVMFASQAALVIVNARRYSDEQRARNALEILLETSPVGVVVFDARTGAPVSFNREVNRIVASLLDTDQTADQLLGDLTCRRSDGREVSLMEWPLAEALSAGETVRAEEIVISIPDGRSVTTLLNATPIRSEQGELESFVVTLQDMTPLQDVERLRAEFLGMVSHELRAPLTSIMGFAAAMQEASPDLDSAELRQFLHIIVEQADNMRELIDDLLDVARIETGTLPVTLEPVDVASLVDRARNTFLSGGGRNSLAIELPPDLPLVMADRRRIAQVIGNLLNNAARHSPESSTIKLNVAREGVHIEVSVTDEGRGIPSDDLPNLFRKFSRGESRERGGDTGLGLAICKGIVEAHGGRIWAESDGPSLGAKFTFTIPVVESSATQSAQPTPNSRRATRGEPILVVDDDPQTLRYARRVLTGAGYETVVTADPEEALRMIKESRPRLVLLDVMLPGYDGIDLMRDIARIADVPVVFLSGYYQDELIAKAFEMGASDYIVKPFTPTELIARARASLRRREGSFRTAPSEPYTLGELSIDYAERLVTVAGEPVRMTAKEYALLFELSVNGGRVLTHDHLLRRIWDFDKPGDIGSLRTLLRRLRQKLGEDASSPKYIFAEARVGYRMAKGETREPIVS